jgi:predicted nucleic acid-binding protein
VQAALLDSTVYISAMRKGAEGARELDALTADLTLWLSAVVLQELYAGAREKDRHVLESLERRMSEANQIVVPDRDDWVRAGKLLALVAGKYGYETIGRSRMTNDALIAVSAGRLSIIVITANKGDFSRLAEFHNFSWHFAAI